MKTPILLTLLTMSLFGGELMANPVPPYLADVVGKTPDKKTLSVPRGEERSTFHQSTRGVLQETWTDIPGATIESLIESAKFRGFPDQARILEKFQTQTTGNAYGSRMSAQLIAPDDGNYTFWIASDDGGELWLGSGSSPATKKKIAWVKGYTKKEEWDKQPNQKSKTIRLKAGECYYIEALLKEGGGKDHLAVAWKGPGMERAIIGNSNLRCPEIGSKMNDIVRQTRKVEEKRKELASQAPGYWQNGKTLPLEYSKTFPLGPQISPKIDNTGINVMIDHTHQTLFAMLWGFAKRLRLSGFRACGTQATLDTVLTPGSKGRVRLSIDDTRPFGWWSVPEMNVVITYQRGSNSQDYLPEDRQALKTFVKNGGGLIIMGGRPKSLDDAKTWTLNELCRVFGGEYTPEAATSTEGNGTVLKLDRNWEILLQSTDGKPMRGRRTFGRGRVYIMESSAALNPSRHADDTTTTAKKKLMEETVTWAAGGKDPVGGESRLPTEMVGGGGIYPELEQDLDGVVVFYARNQKPNLLKVFSEDLPNYRRLVYKWMPSQKPTDPMYIIASSGGGGGWACNYKPKENGVISLHPHGIVGVFAHELAHTMRGPTNADGIAAARPPSGLSGEAYAGWWQGKAKAHYTGDTSRENRNGNSILALEKKKGRKLDLAREYENKTGNAFWGKGKSWTKMWWVWQKLEDKYGVTWFPRWYWVRATRWKHKPEHKQTWEEMIEDMSIAAGEDLFPWFKRIGTSLKRDRLASIVFQGKTLMLPVAGLDEGPAGPVKLDLPGDYTKPLKK